MALIRTIAMLGAGGVLYLTPMVFHHADFSAGRVTEGLALAAVAGTLGRLLSGLLLDRGLNCAVPVLLAALMAIAGDARLMVAGSYGGYLQGQVLLGVAVGFYWPAIELAVPLSCAPMRSGRAFALMRSADALGVATGALVGAVLAWRGWLRGIYAVDIVCMLVLLLVLMRQGLPDPRPRQRLAHPSPWGDWLPGLTPLLAIAVLATAMLALIQSALPLDLVRGSLLRRALPDSLGALTIGLQLGLLVLLQWPVGQALAQRPVTTGLNLSLLCFTAGNLLLAASAFSERGLALLLLAQLPLALGVASFLPTVTEAVVECSPIEHQGLALALLSQCFAISGLGAPLLAGRLLDGQGHGAGLWLLMALACLGGLLLVRRLGSGRAFG
ncbi:MAG: MFS transporter [Cyanobium sp. CZS 25K]|nr:MFS transporter [Cyanobium sp. CZS25K]